jgi:hypothetical protein
VVHPDNGIVFSAKREMSNQAMKRHGGTLNEITK